MLVVLPYPHRLFNWLVRNRWDTGARLASLTDLPILFLSSLQVGGWVHDKAVV
jgi:hypothetical protein